MFKTLEKLYHSIVLSEFHLEVIWLLEQGGFSGPSQVYNGIETRLDRLQRELSEHPGRPSLQQERAIKCTIIQQNIQSLEEQLGVCWSCTHYLLNRFRRTVEERGEPIEHAYDQWRDVGPDDVVCDEKQLLMSAPLPITCDTHEKDALDSINDISFGRHRNKTLYRDLQAYRMLEQKYSAAKPTSP